MLFTGWYWGGMTASDAQAVLQAASEGTFLVRDSSHPLYMLTLSVKTKRGPTNVRIQYSCGRFQLDSSSPARPRLLSFPDISSLVQHYVGSGRGTPEDGRTGMDEVEEQGNKKKRGKEKEERDKADTEFSPLVTEARDSAVLLKLKRPLCKPQAFPSLQHLTRLTINKHVACSAHLPLPGPLLRYIQEYPFQLWWVLGPVKRGQWAEWIFWGSRPSGGTSRWVPWLSAVSRCF